MTAADAAISFVDRSSTAAAVALDLESEAPMGAITSDPDFGFRRIALWAFLASRRASMKVDADSSDVRRQAFRTDLTKASPSSGPLEVIVLIASSLLSNLLSSDSVALLGGVHRRLSHSSCR